MNRRAFFATVLTAVAGRPVLSAAKPLRTTKSLSRTKSLPLLPPEEQPLITILQKMNRHRGFDYWDEPR